MDPMQFTQVVSRLRVLETRLLDKAKIDRMIDSDSANDAFKILQETEYINVMTDIKSVKDYEKMLSAELKRVYKESYDMSPSKPLVDIMSIKYDYHNAKVILKGIFLKKDFSNMLIWVGRVDIDKLRFNIENNHSELSKIMRKAVEEVEEDFKEKKDPQRIDILLDRYMFVEMMDIAKSLEDKFTIKYVKALIDLTNIKSLLRIKKQNKGKEFLLSAIIDGGEVDKDALVSLLTDASENIPSKLSHTNYEGVLKLGVEDFIKTDSTSLLEKLVDNYIMDLMKEAKFIPFGGESLIAYIYAKETEIKVIRIIMASKLNNITSKVIRERLRDIYV